MAKAIIVGLSISGCIADILKGKVNLEDVDFVVAGTRCITEKHWSHVFKSYSEYYWCDLDTPKALGILNYWREKGIIDQPRTRGEEAPNLVNGRWMVYGKQTFSPYEVIRDLTNETIHDFDPLREIMGVRIRQLKDIKLRQLRQLRDLEQKPEFEAWKKQLNL